MGVWMTAAVLVRFCGAVPAADVFESRPNVAGEYVYEAASARPLVAGYDFTLENNRFGKGFASAVVPSTRGRIGLPDNGGAYWKLGAIQPGPYWVGLVYQSGGLPGGGKAEATATAGHGLYLNGRIIQCDRLGDPVEIEPGVWFAELQAQAAEILKPGDEIAVLAPPHRALRVARLILHPRAPILGPFRWPINYGGHWWQIYTALGVNTEVRFLTAGGSPADFADPYWGMEQKAESPESLARTPDAGRALAQCVIANPLSVPVTVDYVCVIKGYYGQEAGRDAQRLTLAAHTRVVRQVPFAVTPDDPSYSADATVKAVDAPALGWPEGDMVSYFAGYRQSVRWPDPFSYRDMRRVFFAGPVEDLHRTLLLNGQWSLAYTTSLNPPMPPPADLQVKPVTVPKPYHTDTLDKITPRPHGGYFSRTFTLPAGIATAGTVRLVVSEVKAEATAYVNGQRVGNVYGESTPLIADITRAIRPGTNELVLVVRDLIAIMDPAYVNPANPVAAPEYLETPGLHGMIGLEVGSVSLETSPAVAADDILVTTSVRRQTVGTRLSVVNHQAAPVKARVKATVLDARRPVFELGEQTVDLVPDRPVSLAFEQPWKNARLWSQADPHLYVLAVEITDSATGARLDLARARFGFRESWIVGPKLYFNGIPVKLKSATTPGTLGTRDDYQLSRNSSLPDYMDEFGYPCIRMITGVYNTSSRHNVEHDPFWANARSNLLIRARRSQNHPCIVAWDLSNEWLCFLRYTSSDMMLGARRMRTLTDTILQQDPSRWTLYNGDGDLEGLLDNMALHYMNPYHGDYAMRGHSSCFPDGAFWRELHQDFEPGKPIVATTLHPDLLFRPYEKVIMDTEYLWKVGGLMPPGLTRFVGDEDVLSPAIDSGAGPAAWFWKQCLDGHRDLGTTSIAIYGHITGAGRRGYQLQAFIMPDVVHHGFAGRTMRWKYALLNDLFVPAELAFSWRLTAPDGGTVAKGRDVRKMSTGDLQRGELTLTLPEVAERTKCTLHLRLESDGQFVNAEERDIDVFPAMGKVEGPVMAGKLERKVLLFEGGVNPTSNAQHPTPNVQRVEARGLTAQALTAVGVAFESIPDLASLAARSSIPAPSSLLIIGEGALDESNTAAVAKLDGFVAAGGRVLLLAQRVTPEGLPAATKLEPREWASQTFVRMAAHPVLQGLTDWDLHFWAADRVVGQGAYTKPDGGAAVTLVDSGSMAGQEWVQLMELYRGKGQYLLCQFPVIAKFGTEPMAGELLARLVRYEAGQSMMLAPTRRMKAVVERRGAIDQRLGTLGAAYDVVTPDVAIEPGAVVLLEAALPATDVQRAGWAAALAQGATMIVSGAKPADAQWLTALAGRPVSITAPRFHMWGGRGYRMGSDALTAGLSQVDLYWKRYAGEESAGAQAEFPELAVEPLQDWSVSVAEARELVFPGALVVLPVGKGQLVLDQRRWFTTHEKLGAPAKRILSALLLGAGVELAPVARPRALPSGVACKPIDLTPFANRALVDDVAEDGVGGWSDQGPKGDLRTFPTGNQNFGGVPFTIGTAPKSCIVLSSYSRPKPETLPAEVTIPVGYPVEGFYFLHASAYGGTYVALYQVQYADGTRVDVPVIYDINIHDWTNPGPFMRETATSSMVAWTGSCPMFASIGVYRMLWVNPKPAVPVKAVRFANPAMKAVPMLLGLTAVVPKGSLAQAPDVQARAQALLAQASRAVAAKDDAAAEKILKEATTLDPTMTAAHQALADVHGRRGDETAALAAYQAWANAGATTPLPYNRIGDILERRKDYKGALAAYTKSLEIEWNQPPAIEAKARLEKLLSSK
jgi:beta-galactosidase